MPASVQAGTTIWPGNGDAAGHYLFHLGVPTASPDPATSPIRVGDLPGTGPCLLKYTNGSPLFVCGAGGTDYQAPLSAGPLSVLVNATTSSGVPSFLGPGAAGQVPQVNGAGTAIVWGAVPSGSLAGTANTLPYFNASGVLTESPSAWGVDGANVRLGSRVPSGLPLFQEQLVDEAGAADRGLTVQTYVAGAAGSLVNLDAAQGSYASPAAVDATKYGGRLAWRFHDGSNGFLERAKIFAHVTPGATVATGSVPTDVAIQSTVSGGAMADAYVSTGARVGLLLRGVQNGYGVNPVGAALPGFANVFGSASTVFGSNSGVVAYNPSNFGTTGIQDNNGQLVLMINNTSGPGPSSSLLRMARSRGTNAAPAAVQPGDQTGGMGYYGYDGSSYITGTAVSGFVDFNSTVTTGNVPMNWAVFSNDGSGLPGLFHGYSDDVVAGNWSQMLTTDRKGFFWVASTAGIPFQGGAPISPQINSNAVTITTAVALAADTAHGRIYGWFGHAAPGFQDTTAMSTGFLKNTTGTGVWSVDTTVYLADPGSNGLLARISSGVTAARTLGSSGASITVTNGNGVSGNPNVEVNLDGATLNQGGGGVVQVAPNGIANGNLRQGAALSVIGRSANSTGNEADISATAASGAALRESGSTIGWGTLATAAYSANSVTYAKIQQASAHTLIGNSGGSTANVGEITLGSHCSFTGSVLDCVSAGGVTSLAQTDPITLSGSTGAVTVGLGFDSTLVVTSHLLGRAHITGDVDITANTSTIGANVVTNGDIRQSGALALIGRSANSPGNVADIQATAGGNGVMRESGSTIGFGSIIEGSVTNLVTDLAAKESLLTFSTGLTRAVNTITADLSTGKAGGQAAMGDTAASGVLTLQSTTNATRGYLKLGNVAGANNVSLYDETNATLSIGDSALAALGNGTKLQTYSAVNGFSGIVSVNDAGAATAAYTGFFASLVKGSIAGSRFGFLHRAPAFSGTPNFDAAETGLVQLVSTSGPAPININNAGVSGAGADVVITAGAVTNQLARFKSTGEIDLGSSSSPMGVLDQSTGKQSWGQTTLDAKAHFVTTSDTAPVPLTAWDGRYFVIGASGSTGAGIGFSHDGTSGVGHVLFVHPNTAWETGSFYALGFNFFSNGSTLGFSQDSGGSDYMATLSAGGMVKAVPSTGGRLALASASDIAAAQTWPAATDVNISTGPTTAPVGDSHFTYNTATHTMESTGINVFGPFSGIAYLNVGALGTETVLGGLNESGGTLTGVVFGASGGGHAMGMVPDPGSTSGFTHALFEDGTWKNVGSFSASFRWSDQSTTGACVGWIDLTPGAGGHYGCGGGLGLFGTAVEWPTGLVPSTVHMIVYFKSASLPSTEGVQFFITRNGTAIGISACGINSSSALPFVCDTGELSVASGASSTDTFGIKAVESGGSNPHSSDATITLIVKS